MYNDKIKVIGGDIEYYYCKEMKKIIKWKDTSRKLLDD